MTIVKVLTLMTVRLIAIRWVRIVLSEIEIIEKSTSIALRRLCRWLGDRSIRVERPRCIGIRIVSIIYREWEWRCINVWLQLRERDGNLPSFFARPIGCSSDKFIWWKACISWFDLFPGCRLLLSEELITAETMAGSSWIEDWTGAGGKDGGTTGNGRTCCCTGSELESSGTIFKSSISLLANCIIGTIVPTIWLVEKLPGRFSVPKHLTLPRRIDEVSESIPRNEWQVIQAKENNHCVTHRWFFRRSDIETWWWLRFDCRWNCSTFSQNWFIWREKKSNVNLIVLLRHLFFRRTLLHQQLGVRETDRRRRSSLTPIGFHP